jgi:hypothetical protein
MNTLYYTTHATTTIYSGATRTHAKLLRLFVGGVLGLVERQLRVLRRVVVLQVRQRRNGGLAQLAHELLALDATLLDARLATSLLLFD